MAHSSSAAAAAEEAPACSCLSIFDLASSPHPPDAAFLFDSARWNKSRIGPWKEEELERGNSPPRSKKRPAGARRWWESTRYGDWRIRPPWWVLRPPRLVSPLLRTAATAVPTLSREDRSGEISVITDHMTSVGWRVPDRLTQDS